ncbi:MAG: GcrA cell cycle regulator [Alphaproteobacteria bacterium]|nr:MAG: GcrA cell cycle regulator [Alphaproteobacteria bacterium]
MDSPWTDARIVDLTKRWLAGESATKIADALRGGITRAAVIGKVHRLGLTGKGVGRQEAAAPNRGAAVKRVQRPVPPRRAPTPPPPLLQGRQGVMVIDEMATRWPVQREAVRATGDAACAWPIGDPRASDFRFCGDEAVPGRRYCASHCRKAGCSDQPKAIQVVGRVARPFSFRAGA